MKVKGGVNGTDHEGYLHVPVTLHVRAFQIQPALGEPTTKRDVDRHVNYERTQSAFINIFL